MDELAKAILEDTIKHNQDVPDALPISTDGLIQVDYEDTPITLNLASTLRYHIGKRRLLDWWSFKHRFEQGVSYEDIDWEVMKCVSE